MKFRVIAVGLAACALLPVAVACGGDDDSTAKTPTSATTTTAQASASSNSNATKAATSGAATTAASPSADASGDLKKAGDKTIPFKAAYSFTDTDAAGNAKDGTLTLAQKDGKSYFKGEGGAFTTDKDPNGFIIVIDDGTNSFLCTEQGQKICIKTKSSSSAGSLAFAFTPDKIVAALTKEAGSQVKQVANQNIAGRDAKCYSVTDKTGTGTACVDAKTGVLLLADGADLTTKGTKTLIKATSFSTSPSDSDFTPPYPVQSLNGQ